MNLEGSFLLLVIALLLMPGVGLLAAILHGVTRCEGDVAKLLALLLIPVVFVSGSLYLDARGTVVRGKVTAKGERIHYGREGFWNRTLSVGIAIPEPEGSRMATPLSVGVAPAQYDRLRVGDHVDVRVLRVGRYFRFGRLAGRETWTAIPWQAVRFFGLLWGRLFLFCLWRPGGRRTQTPPSGVRRQLLRIGAGVWLGVFALPLLRPAPAPAGRSLAATAAVRRTERVTTLWKSTHSSGIEAPQPFDLVELEFTPAGRSEPVPVVDKVDAGSVPGLAEGKNVAVTYPESDPRAAQISGARRTHVWKNQFTPLYGLRDACLALALVGVFFLLPLHLLIRFVKQRLDLLEKRGLPPGSDAGAAVAQARHRVGSERDGGEGFQRRRVSCKLLIALPPELHRRARGCGMFRGGVCWSAPNVLQRSADSWDNGDGQLQGGRMARGLRASRATTALSGAGEANAPRVERTAEEIISDLFARVPRRSPEDLAALARRQGKVPAARFEDLLGEGPADGDEFDVDEFLAARERWQAEEGLHSAHLAEPDDAEQ